MKLNRRTLAIRGLAGIFVMLMYISCVTAKSSIQIPDYLILPNGIEENGNYLNAFVFENNLRGESIEAYLNRKLKTDNYSDRVFYITIEKDKYKLILYDNAEFDKYFGATNFAVIHLEPQSVQSGSQREFIAISIVDAYDHDCLAEDSLLQNIAVKYLKSLKDDYIANETR